jgi:hypothetical protein
MKIKQKLKILIVGALLIGVMFAIIAPTSGYALGANGCEAETAIIKCNNVVEGGEVQQSGLWSLLLTAINILTAGVGIVAIGGIIYASVLYTSAGGSQEQVKKAMGIIRNVVIGIVAYALMYSALNFLIPGGIFA